MKTRRSLPRVLATLFATLLLGAPALPAAVLTGRVLDQQTGAYLAGATVRIAGTDLNTTTDRDGRFTFADAPAGAQRVTAEYFGYDSVSTSVSVAASGTTSTELAFHSNVVRLDAVMVEGYREGRAKALQQKRTMDNLAEIISADSIGNLPDRNVAEAVARAPGVNLSLDQGEGRYVSIRGIEPNLNQVLVDGAVMAAPGGSRFGRAVPLDSLGTGQVAQIEVIKSATPDMDANALGGTINLKSASAFDRKGRFLAGSFSGNRNETTRKNDAEARVSFSDTFGSNKQWGIAAGLNYEKRHFSNHWVQSSWNQRVINGANVYLPSGFEIKPEFGEQSRTGGNLSLEFRPDSSLQFYLRPSYSRTSRKEETVEVLHSVDNTAARTTLTTPTSGTFAGTGTRTERRHFDSLKTQGVFSVSAGFKWVRGDFTLEPMLTHSAAKEETPYNRILAFRNPNGGTGNIGFDIGEFEFRRWDVDPTVDLPARYTLRRTRDDSGLVDEKTSTAKVDLRWDTSRHLDRPSYLKTGYKYLRRERNVNLESSRLVPVGNWNLSAIGTLPAVPVYDGRYTSGFLLNPGPTWAYLRANPALTVFDPTDSGANSIEDDYDIDEHIFAAYGMGHVKLGRLTLLGGLRWEKTDATIRAVEARFAGATLLGRFPKSGRVDYDTLFPNLQGIFRFNDQLLLRAAMTRTIGRPAYEDARPLATFRYDALGAAALSPQFPFSGTVNVGNPNLGPYDAANYDLSLEWYLRGSGIFSIAGFRKDIDDPIYLYSETQRNVVYSGISLESLGLTSRRNADSGRISGIEFNLYQPFKFLPSPFDGFGLDANYTRINSDVRIPTRPGEDIPFFRQPSKITNVTLFYEKYGFSARVAYSHADRQIYTLGSNILNDIYRNPRGQYDVQLRYRINQRYSVQGSIRNLTREPEKFSYGVNGLIRSSRLLDRDYKLGVSVNF